MAGFREAGAAFIRIFTKNDVKPGLNQAEADVRAATGRMQDSARAAFSPLKDLRKTLNDTVGVVLSLIARATALAAVVTGLALAAKAFYDWMRQSEIAIAELQANTAKLAADTLKVTRGLSGEDVDPKDTIVNALVDNLNEQLGKARKLADEAKAAIRYNAAGEVVLASVGAQKRFADASEQIRMLEALRARVGESNDKRRADEGRAAVEEQLDAINKDQAERAADALGQLAKEAEEKDKARERLDAQSMEALQRRIDTEYDARIALERELARIREESERRVQDLMNQFSGGNVSQDQRVIRGTLERIATNTGRARR